MSDKDENTTTETTTTSQSEDLSGLKSKVRELMGKLKDANEALEAAKDENSDDLTKAKNRITKLEADLKASNERAEKSETGLRSYKSETDINKAFAAAKVNGDHSAILTSHFKSLVEWDDEGNPHIGGKSIDDFAKSYFASEGKHYTLAANNSGGKAQGNDGTEAVEGAKAPETSDEYLKFYALPEETRATLAERWQMDELHPRK